MEVLETGLLVMRPVPSVRLSVCLSHSGFRLREVASVTEQSAASAKREATVSENRCRYRSTGQTDGRTDRHRTVTYSLTARSGRRQ